MIQFLKKPHISYSRIKRYLSVSETAGHFSNDGPLKRMLEDRLADYLEIDDNKRVVCCNNGTSALHAVMFLSATEYNVDNWITPAFTFPSVVVGGTTFNVDIQDIDLDTYTLPMDYNLLKKYDGILITNLFGSFVDLDGWAEFCKTYNKVLVLDNASSPLSKCGGNNICNFGDYACGSLHHTKYLGFGEGGFIVAPFEKYDKINSLLNFGFMDNKDYQPLSSNFKMSDVTSAFILSHIDSYDIDKHIAVQNKLIDGISGISGVYPFNYKSGTVYNSFPVLFSKDIDSKYFEKFNITTHKYYQPLKPLLNSTKLYNRIVNFPLYSFMKNKDINGILSAIKHFVGQ